MPMDGLRADDARLPLVVLRAASAATVTASAYLLFALYCSAPPAFIGLQSLSCPPSFQCCTGIRAHSSVCCSGRISCPKLGQAGGADGALREDHLVYGQIARGQPKMRKAAVPSII